MALDNIVVIRSTYASQLSVGSVNRAADLVYQDLLTELIHRQLNEAILTRNVSPRWSAVINGLYRHAPQGPFPRSLEQFQPYELERRYLAQKCQPWLAQSAFEPGDWLYQSYTAANEVADPLVEYILVTYGRAAIPALLDALACSEQWSQVPPLAFGISDEQFTAEWHDYLADHYPIELPD